MNKERDGLGSRERAENIGMGGTMCHCKASGHLAVSTKGTRLLSFPSFLFSLFFLCQPFITVVTVADTVRVRITALQYFGVWPGYARRQLWQELGDNSVHSDRGKANLKRGQL